MIIQILGASILSTLVVLPENPGCLKCWCEFEADRLEKKSIFQLKKLNGLLSTKKMLEVLQTPRKLRTP